MSNKMNVSIPSKRKCPLPVLHEKQKSLLCGKHAINNVLQRNVATCARLLSIGKTLSKQYDTPLNELVNAETGYYDASVLVSFMNTQGYDLDILYPPQFYKMSRRQSPRLLGYIFGDGTHWMSIRKTTSRGCYFKIDSLDQSPERLRIVKRWLLKNPSKLMAIKVMEPKKGKNVSIIH